MGIVFLLYIDIFQYGFSYLIYRSVTFTMQVLLDLLFFLFFDVLYEWYVRCITCVIASNCFDKFALECDTFFGAHIAVCCFLPAFC